jgi:ATP-dependent exoDNAse (exonuclease V) beta subunit
MTTRDALPVNDSSAWKADDAADRDRALDVTESFLVRAPAGSGKTSLLIQRFLALLAHVDRPERIVAMTFTRKAAAEMRERIIEALRRAAQEDAPRDGHERRTLELAAKALAQDKRQDWQLASHPARLQILTIDALCAGLVSRAPLTSRIGAGSRFKERAAPLYRRAAREALRAAAPRDSDWQNLVSHLDNDAQQTIAQLAGMLERREQWLRELPTDGAGALRQRAEAALAAEIRGELSTLRDAFPAKLATALAACERYAADNLDGKAEAAERIAALRACAVSGGLPPASVDALPLWRALAGWLLLANGREFRKSVDAKTGFPPKGSGSDGRVSAMKAAMCGVLEQLAELRGLAHTLGVAARLPPARYSEEAWGVVSSLAKILRVCAAELLLAFEASGTVDFPQLTLSALEALGEADAPSDLLLLFDRWLDHLLIDEFQDTSFSQLELIRRLTAGWQHGDGRTLFAVGDPMQSIYRFRQAEVRFFVEAQQSARIAEVRVELLTLRKNFRSRPRLVEWVNKTFPQILGAVRDPWRSIVAFEAAVATRDPLNAPACTLDLVGNPAAEATMVVDRVRAALGGGGAQDVAVLVRARAQLEQVLPELRRAGIPYAAIELDALSDRQVVRDLVSLTHALTQPADRLAWLSVLRAPWCGLMLADLFALVSTAETEGAATLADLLSSARASTALSAEGRERFARVGGVLSASLAARGRATLAARTRGAWLALGGPACIEEAFDLAAAEQFFALLAEHEEAGEVAEWVEFLDALAELRAAPAAEDESTPKVKVMTLHKAKGLEFDTVILPGLGSKAGRSEPPLLRWRQRPDGVLLAPMRARGGDKDPVYEYLKLLEREEEDAELGRLLYVGCTRAREKLHLIGALETKIDAAGELRWTSPERDSALAKLWDAVETPQPQPKTGSASLPLSPPKLSRLPQSWRVPAMPLGIPPLREAERRTPEAAPLFDWAHETARHIGTVAHRLCKQMGDEGFDAWNDARLSRLTARIAAELAHEGVAAADIDAAAAVVRTALEKVLTDVRARWLFDTGHREAVSELALTSMREAALVDVVLDRSFVDAEGTRWIVDFKFSRHEGADVDAFLENERERYRAQLEGYAEAMRGLDARPIRLGLYFPLLGGWREWPAP